MIALALAGVFGALGTITWMHLRRISRGRARPFPSLQLLDGASPRHRPEPRIEEPIRWALRAGALLLAALAIGLARSNDSRAGLAIVVDPAGGPGGVAFGRRLLAGAAKSAHAVLLSFDGGRVVAEGEPGSDRTLDLRRRIESCGASRVECLWRAAAEQPSVLAVSPFGSAAWATALRARPRSFFYRRVPPVAAAAEAAPAEEVIPPACRVDRADDDPASRIWEAAIVATTRGPATGGCVIRVGLASESAEIPNGGVARLLLAAGPAARTEALPAAAIARSPALKISDDLAPVAARRALALEASLAFQSDSRFESVLGPILIRRVGPGPPVLAAAASRDDLARWANDGSLLALARVVLFEACRGETFSSLRAPLPTSAAWVNLATRAPSPVGLLDVPPGRYEREDGRLTFERKRDPDAPSIPASDAELAALGGKNQLPPTRSSAGSILILVLLGLAAAARLADVPNARAITAAAAYFVGVAALTLWILDLPIPSPGRADLSARTAGHFEPAERAGLAEALARADIKLDSESGIDAGSVAVAGREPVVPVDALVFPAASPRVDLLSVDFPREVRLGEAARLRVVVETRRAAGRVLLARAVADNGSGGESTVKVETDSAVIPLSLTMTPASAGVSLASVLVRFADRPESDPDGAVFAVVTRPDRRRFLVASTAPSWDARAAADALAGSEIEVVSLTALGKTAVVGRGAAPADPSDALARAGALDRVDAVVLTGSEPLREPARASLETFVRRGGGLLILGPVPGAPSLAAAGPSSGQFATESPVPVVGASDNQTFDFSGFLPLKTPLEIGSEILATLSERGHDATEPWIGGRGLGNGRIVEVLVPDLWRLGGPGSSRTGSYATLIRELSGWLLAARTPAVTIRIAGDLTSFVVNRNGRAERAVAASGVEIDGLNAESRDPLSAAPCARARQRARALRRGRVLVEADSASELARIWKRLPRPENVNRSVAARFDDRVAAVFLIVLVIEVFLRRRARAGRGPAAIPRPREPA